MSGSGNGVGRSIRLFLVDGVAYGVITAEIMNWSGHVMAGPRSALDKLLAREEVKRTGLYFLAGSTGDEGRPQLYIGETDSIANRLTTHNKDVSKDFWERTCIVTSKDQNITKAHVRYLESRFIEIAKNAGSAELINNTAPSHQNYLPESDRADMEFFIDQVRLILPVLGFDFLRDRPRARSNDPVQMPSGGDPAEGDESIFILGNRKHGISARARQIDGEFVVLAGSQARARWEGRGDDGRNYAHLHRRLVAEGKLVEVADETHRVFAMDVAFTSPSAASAVVVGRSSNGRVEWRLSDGRTYADWQNDNVAAVTQRTAS